MKDRRVASEGLKSNDADWIIIDISIAQLHIVSPEARISYELDSVLGGGTNAVAGDENAIVETLLKEYRQSLPRREAGDPMRLTREEKEALKNSHLSFL